jgi:hypothetical protein
MDAGRGHVPKDQIEQFILRLSSGTKPFDEECEFVSGLRRVDRDYRTVGRGTARIDLQLRRASSRMFMPLAGGVLEPSWTATVIPWMLEGKLTFTIFDFAMMLFARSRDLAAKSKHALRANSFREHGPLCHPQY